MSAQRTVLQVIPRLPVGGAETLLADLVRHLPARYRSVVCCLQERGPMAEQIERAGVPVVCLERMRSRRFDWGAIGRLADLIRRERIALVHTHLYHANLYGRLAAARAGVPAIATVHNTYQRMKWHRRLLNRWLARRSARVVAVSDDIRRDLARYDRIPEDRITTIANGIDPARARSALSRAEARARLGLRDADFAVACVARLEEQKGHRFLLDALALLAREEPQLYGALQLFLVGDGRLRAPLQARAAELGLPAVRFLGTRRDVPDILAAMDLHAMASLWEGLSIALLEAMAAGLPVVASDVGGVATVLGDAAFGIRVPPQDAPALAAALAQAYARRGEREALGAAARRAVEERFSIHATVAKFAALYDEACGPRAR